MAHPDPRSTVRPEYDPIIQSIADYICHPPSFSPATVQTAHFCLMDSLASGILALSHSACTDLMGPLVPGAEIESGAKVPGTAYQLDPVTAAFNMGLMIRYLDFNDTWLAAEWGHPSDNLGAILAVADYLNRNSDKTVTIEQVLHAMIQAHEIQGVLALENSFNGVGLDHVLLVRVASTAVVTKMLGGSKEQVMAAVSQAFMDGGALRAYRHAPNTGPRKSWAAGDATSRAVRLALLTLKGQMGYPAVLSTPTWGFESVLFNGQTITLAQPLQSYVMDNILFKISYPAEFHAQTAVECALKLHETVKDRIDDIEKLVIETQAAGKKIIDKTGPLHNYADRDHCMQYMVAVPLIFGRLDASSYSDQTAQDPRIDVLRSKMEVRELTAFTKSYFEPSQRAISNAIKIQFKDGSVTDRIKIDYPVGHRTRRHEGIPLLIHKFESAIDYYFKQTQAEAVKTLFADQNQLASMSISEFMDCWATD